MIKGVSRTCGVSILLRVRPINRPLFTKSLADIIFYSRDDAVDAFERQDNLPPPCHAHSTTLVGRMLVMIGEGENTSIITALLQS